MLNTRQLLLGFISYLFLIDACTCDRDHAGGNEKIKELVPGIRVYGGSLDNVKGCTNKVENGDRLSIGKDINILALHTPWYGLLFIVPSNISSTVIFVTNSKIYISEI